MIDNAPYVLRRVSCMADLSFGNDMRAFSDASPSPAHAVADIVRRLRAGGVHRAG